MLAHEATQLLAVHHHALVAQGRPDATVAVALELVADRANAGDELVHAEGNGRRIVEGGAREAHQLAPPLDGDGVGPVTTEVVALLDRGACFKAPFSNSIVCVRPARLVRGREALLFCEA